MRVGGDHSVADQERLALYLMGALDDAERESFEAHLADCWHCLEEAAEIGPTISGLAGLGDADWSLPTDESPLPPPGTGVASAVSSVDIDPALSAPDADPVSPSPAADTGSTPSSSGTSTARVVSGVDEGQGDSVTAVGDPPNLQRGGESSGSVRPRGSRPTGSRPSGTRPGGATAAGARRRRRAVWAAAAAVVLVLAGGVVAVNEWFARPDPVLTATGEAPGYGVSLSVVITTGDQGSATIRITATGLRQGTRYRLFAVTRDGATHVIRDWTASSGPQDVAGETSLPVDELSFITVGLTDGSAIVTAPIARNPASPR